MKAKDIKKKDISEIEKDLNTLRVNLANFRGNSSGSKQRNVKEGRNIKKDIARLLTEMNSKKQG